MQKIFHEPQTLPREGRFALQNNIDAFEKIVSQYLHSSLWIGLRYSCFQLPDTHHRNRSSAIIKHSRSIGWDTGITLPSFARIGLFPDPTIGLIPVITNDPFVAYNQ